jgi:hypothetical protein
MNPVMDVSPLAGLGNTLNGWITMFSVDRNTKVALKLEYEYGRLYEILDTRHIYFGNVMKDHTINPYWTAHFLVVKSETEQQDTHTIPNNWRHEGHTMNPNLNTLFSDTQIALCFNPDLFCDSLKKRYIRAIRDIVWSSPIRESMKDIYVKNNSLGISVRTWKADHEKNIPYSYNFEAYKETIEKTIRDTRIDHIYFSIDNDQYKQPYLDLFKTLNIPYTELNESYKKMTKSQSTILKAMTLGRCDYFIGHRLSSFCELVFWLSELRTKVITVPSQMSE